MPCRHFLCLHVILWKFEALTFITFQAFPETRNNTVCLRLCDQGLPPAILTLKQNKDFTTFVFPHSLCFQATAAVCEHIAWWLLRGTTWTGKNPKTQKDAKQAERDFVSRKKTQSETERQRQQRLHFHTRDLVCEFTVDHFCCTANRKNRIVFIVNKIKCSPCRVKRNSLNIITKESNKKES